MFSSAGFFEWSRHSVVPVGRDLNNQIHTQNSLYKQGGAKYSVLVILLMPISGRF
jgi:hypothetical protein